MYIGRSDWPSAVTLKRYIDGRNEAYNSSRFCRLSSRARYIVSRNASAGDAVGRFLCVVSMFAIVRLRLDTCALGGSWRSRRCLLLFPKLCMPLRQLSLPLRQHPVHRV